jgi:hypothetical protein
MPDLKAFKRCWLIYPLAFLALVQFHFLCVGSNARGEVERFESRLLTAFYGNRQGVSAELLKGHKVSRSQLTTSRFAYAFLVAGCDPSRPSYRGFLYNVLVAKHVLKAKGSTADVLLMLRMASNATKSLPAEEEQMLRDGGILFRYLPPPDTKETFYSAMMAKFHILNLTEYSRVLYMDADVTPWCNLDYLFVLSEKGVLKENLVIAWWHEPASGGFFMLKPGIGELDALNDVIHRQQVLAKNQSSWPPFDVAKGWGHEIKAPDKWKTLMKGEGTNWTFQVCFSMRSVNASWQRHLLMPFFFFSLLLLIRAYCIIGSNM